jgi:hypothetical protein
MEREKRTLATVLFLFISQTNVYITAEIWDEGDGLDEITAPNTPTNSLLLNGFSKGLVKAVGIVRATLMYVMFFNCHFNMKCVGGGGGCTLTSI